MAIADCIPVYGLKSHYRIMQCQDLRVLKGLCRKTTQKRVIEGSNSILEKKLEVGPLPSPLNLVDFAQFGLEGSKGQGRGHTPYCFFLR